MDTPSPSPIAHRIYAKKIHRSIKVVRILVCIAQYVLTPSACLVRIITTFLHLFCAYLSPHSLHAQSPNAYHASKILSILVRFARKDGKRQTTHIYYWPALYLDGKAMDQSASAGPNAKTKIASTVVMIHNA